MNLTVWERCEAVALQEVKDALSQEIHDNANMTSIIKAVTQVDAAIPVLVVVGLERSEHSQLYPGGIAILLD